MWMSHLTIRLNGGGIESDCELANSVGNAAGTLYWVFAVVAVAVAWSA